MCSVPIYIQLFVNNVEFYNCFREIILMHISLVVRVTFYSIYIYTLLNFYKTKITNHVNSFLHHVDVGIKEPVGEQYQDEARS